MNEELKPVSGAVPAVPSTDRDHNAIYQGNKLVARVVKAEVDWETKEIRFGEIYDSDDVSLSEECEFQNYRIMVQRVEFASRIDKRALEKGRVLQGVVAEILGYREQ